MFRWTTLRWTTSPRLSVWRPTDARDALHANSSRDDSHSNPNRPVGDATNLPRYPSHASPANSGQIFPDALAAMYSRRWASPPELALVVGVAQCQEQAWLVEAED